MAINITEQVHSNADRIDMLSSEQAATLLLGGQVSAVQAVDQAVDEIVAAATALAASVRAGGNIVYCAAGSSGLMALADGLELPGTFGIPNNRIKILLAGGNECLTELKGGPEDDGNLAASDIAKIGLSRRDVVIALSASGSTPYAIKCLAMAHASGAKTVGIANNIGAPLLRIADIAIYLPTPPEVVAGSTRMGAASAQKVTLNTMSTLMAIQLGHVHGGHMVNVVADNEKLKQRARHMVVSITECNAERATEALQQSGGNVKIACLLAIGAEDQEAAKIILERNDQNLRSSLNELTTG